MRFRWPLVRRSACERRCAGLRDLAMKAARERNAEYAALRRCELEIEDLTRDRDFLRRRVEALWCELDRRDGGPGIFPTQDY